MFLDILMIRCQRNLKLIEKGYFLQSVHHGNRIFCTKQNTINILFIQINTTDLMRIERVSNIHEAFLKPIEKPCAVECRYITASAYKKYHAIPHFFSYTIP